MLDFRTYVFIVVSFLLLHNYYASTDVVVLSPFSFRVFFINVRRRQSWWASFLSKAQFIWNTEISVSVAIQARFIWNAEISISIAIQCYERLF